MSDRWTGIEGKTTFTIGKHLLLTLILHVWLKYFDPATAKAF